MLNPAKILTQYDNLAWIKAFFGLSEFAELLNGRKVSGNLKKNFNRLKKTYKCVCNFYLVKKTIHVAIKQKECSIS